MPRDTLQANCFQVVFLIDSNASFWGHKSNAEHATNTIRLCVLKVLTYFSNLVEGKESNLRWGYKFFSSNSLSHHCERHELKEFAVNVFEEFEHQVVKKFNESFKRQGISIQENNDQELDESASSNKPPVGAKCISCALTNTVHDFQWIRPDIGSPVRPRTRGNIVHSNRQSTRNVVFLLSGCPCDGSSVFSFTGENEATLDSLQNAIMPPVLLKEFKDRCDIRLHWVNIGSTQSGQQNTSLTLLLDHILKRLGGCLIPISSLVYTGNIFSQPFGSDISDHGPDCDISKEANSSSLCGSLLPFKSVMDFYLCHRKNKVFDLCNIQGSIVNDQFGDRKGWLCSTGAEDKIHCAVRLNSMFKPSSCQTPADDSTSNENKSIQISANLLWIRGMVNHSCVCPSLLHPMKAYSCVGMSGSETANHVNMDQSSSTLGCTEFLSGWFQEVLLSLAKERKLLILDFADPDSGAPVTGVLQPLTSICGVISLVSSDFLVTFEKLLVWNGKAAEQKSSNKKMTSEISYGMVKGQNSTAAVTNTVQPGCREVFLNLPGSQNVLAGQTTDGLRQFEAGFLDPWCCFSDVVDVKKSFCSELHRPFKSEDEGSDNEAALMKELKDLYNRQETISESTTSQPKQTPKKNVKRNSQTPKQAKDILRSSSRLRSNVDQKVKADEADTILGVSGGEASLEKDPLQQLSTVQHDGDVSNSSTAQQAPSQIKDQSQLTHVIQEIYSRVIVEGTNLLEDLGKIVSEVSKFSLNAHSGDQKICASQFLGKHLLLPITGLREKHEGCETDINKEQRFREYQLQILLRAEIAVMTKADDDSPLVEEVIAMLRAISFMKDPNFLSVYLREVLLQRYTRQIPKFLCGVYEGLMMRPPSEILSPSKWSSDDESPVRRPIESQPNSRQDSNQPRSSGCRVLTRHMSITEMTGKRREIVVPGKAKPREKEKKKKEKQQGAKKLEDKKTPVKLVRRNLFTEEGDSSNENGSTTRVHKKHKVSERGKQDGHRRKFHRRNTIGSFSKSSVQETPAHKQVSHALWCKQDRARKRSKALPEAVCVLQESPLKEIQAGEGPVRRSPRRHPGVIFQRSQSFYGRSASAGPITRTKSFTAPGSCDSPKKGSVDSSYFSPSKGALVKKTRLAGALSPLRFSPRHKKKFSLHSLLTTTKECSEQKRPTTSGSLPTTSGKPNASGTSPNTSRTSTRHLHVKTRSFSYIGFSSVPFAGHHGKEVDSSCPDPGLCENTVPCKTPVKENIIVAARCSKTPLKTPKRENTEKEFTEMSQITPKSKQTIVEGQTPPRDLQMDQCVVLLTPIRKPLLPTAACSIGHTQPRIGEELSEQRPEEILDRLCSDNRPMNVKLMTPVKKVVGPATRCSPRLLSKQKESAPSVEESGKSGVEAADPAMQMEGACREKASSTVVSPISTRKSTGELETPTKNHHLDDFIVLLTPVRLAVKSPRQVSMSPRHVSMSPRHVSMSPRHVSMSPRHVSISPRRASISPRHVSISPRHVSSQEKSRSVTFFKDDCQPVEELVTNTVEVGEGKLETAAPTVRRLLVSPRSSPRFSKISDDETARSSTRTSSALSSDSEQLRERLPLKLKKKSPPSHPTTSTPSLAGETKSAKYGKLYAADIIVEEDKHKLETSTSGFSCIPNVVIQEETKEHNKHLLSADRHEVLVPISKGAVSRMYIEPPHSSNRWSPAGAQLSWSQRSPHSTPPPKKRRKNLSASVEKKRASPLNQILRQRKRKRGFSNSPIEKCSREAIGVRASKWSPHSGNTSRARELELPNSSRVLMEDNSSRSSEDVDDWITEIEKEYDDSVGQNKQGDSCRKSSPPAKKQRIHKSVVFGRKSNQKGSSKKSENRNKSSLSSDTSVEEDDEVFQSPSVTALRVTQRRTSRTPLSASSIKVLQESPILFDSKLPISLSPSCLTRKWSDFSPSAENQCRKERLRRRRFPSESESKEANTSDRCASDEEQPVGFNLRKRLKLGTT